MSFLGQGVQRKNTKICTIFTNREHKKQQKATKENNN